MREKVTVVTSDGDLTLWLAVVEKCVKFLLFGMNGYFCGYDTGKGSEDTQSAESQAERACGGDGECA